MAKGKANITEVTFGRVFNLGNSETYRVELKATVGPGETAFAVVAALDAETVRMRQAHKDGKPFQY
jgi:hypothetical protein